MLEHKENKFFVFRGPAVKDVIWYIGDARPSSVPAYWNVFTFFVTGVMLLLPILATRARKILTEKNHLFAAHMTSLFLSVMALVTFFYFGEFGRLRMDLRYKETIYFFSCNCILILHIIIDYQIIKRNIIKPKLSKLGEKYEELFMTV